MASIINASTSTGLVTTADTSGVLQLQTAGTTALTVDASQNVGIGTASPVLKLDVSGKVKFTGVEIAVSEDYTTNLYYSGGWKYRATGYGTTIGASSGAITFNNTASSGTADAAATVSERMRIDSSGNVGIGTSSPLRKLDVYGDAQFKDVSGIATTIYSEITTGVGAVGTDNNYPFAFATNGIERARIDSSGNLLVGKTVTSIGTAGTWIEGTGSLVSSLAASTSSSSTLHAYSTTASAYRFYVGMDGRVNATLTTIAAISDERLKENIKDLDFGLSEVLSLKPRRFDWKEGKGADTKDAVGFIAQEFETVFPNSVGTAKAGEDEIEYKNICHDELIPTLVKAIQEQQAIITSLTDRITALEGTTP